jgi:hypothetical protein
MLLTSVTISLRWVTSYKSEYLFKTDILEKVSLNKMEISILAENGGLKFRVCNFLFKQSQQGRNGRPFAA